MCSSSGLLVAPTSDCLCVNTQEDFPRFIIYQSRSGDAASYLISYLLSTRWRTSQHRQIFSAPSAFFLGSAPGPVSCPQVFLSSINSAVAFLSVFMSVLFFLNDESTVEMLQDYLIILWDKW